MDRQLASVIAERVWHPFVLGMLKAGSDPAEPPIRQSLYLLLQACFIVTVEAKGYLPSHLIGPQGPMKDPEFRQYYREVLRQAELPLETPPIPPVAEEYFAEGFSQLLGLRDTLADLPLLWLAELYAHLKDYSLDQNKQWALQKPRRGAYYTPIHITRFLAEQTLGPLIAERQTGGVLDTIRVLDPSMGCGHFIFTALDFLLETLTPYYQQKEDLLNRIYTARFQRQPPEETRQRLLHLLASDSLYGIDLDDLAVYVCKLILVLYAKLQPVPPSFAQGLRVGNALWGAWSDEVGLEGAKLNNIPSLREEYGSLFDQYLRQLSPSPAVPFHWELEFPEVFLGEKKGFDVILANPPYLHVKRSMDPQTKKALAQRFTLARGQWDQGALFIEQSLKRLINRQGYIGMILPKPFFTAQNFEALRRMILEHSHIQSFGPCGVCFAQPSVEANILVLTGKPTPRVTITELCGKQFRKTKTIPAEIFPRLPFCTFSYLIEPHHFGEIVSNLQQGNYVFLDRLVTWKRGVELGKGGTTTSGVPCITGEDLTSFRAVPRAFIQPTDDLTVYKEPSLYKRPEKLLLRRVAQRPIAAVDTTGAYVLNTIYVGTTVPGVSPHALCAVLNSDFFAGLFEQLFNLDDKLFPYLRISQLDRVPIPPALGSCPRLAEISRRLHTMLPKEEEAELLREIEAIVREAYQVG